jgi:hypothetical protein
VPFPALVLAAALAVSCAPAAPRDLAADQAEMASAMAPVEAAQTQRLKTYEQAPASSAAFLALQHRYHQERFAALRPLVERGNASAILAVARQYQSADSGFADPAEWTRLMHCASDLGEPIAVDERMVEFWHDKGDGTFAAVRRNRAAALDLAERLARQGNPLGIVTAAIYIGGGRHQYPIDPDLGRRLFVLCIRMGDHGCGQFLIDAAERGAALAPQDPVDLYVLMAEVARREPIRYAARREALWARLTDEQRAAVPARIQAWATRSWAELQPEWAALRAEIESKDQPSSVACLRGHLCPRV